MSDSLSQEEIDALLKGAAAGGEEAATVAPEAPAADAGASADVALDVLTDAERDTLGEIGNICMASAATTLSMLLGHQVVITTPQVSVRTEPDVVREYHRPAAVVQIRYTEGLDGVNMFVISTSDASIVADLMMGGSGTPSEDMLDEIQMSAVGEAMNQMMGAAATAMASMLGRRVDISSPEVTPLDLTDDTTKLGIVGDNEPMVVAAFGLQVGDLIETTLMQLMPVPFARSLVEALYANGGAAGEPEPAAAAPAPAPAAAPVAAPAPAPAPPPPAAAPAAPPASAAVPVPVPAFATGAVAQPVAFPSLGDPPPAAVAGDIGLLMDVPLQVSVELGRTELRIRNVLELVPGSIIELERLAGEPVDVLVNGKQIARGEVVVIDEEFGIRITEIASQASRLRGLAES